MADHARVVGVYPPGTVDTHARLLNALSSALAVSFQPLSGDSPYDAIISLAGFDSLSGLDIQGKPCYAAPPNGQRAENLGITFSGDELVDSRLQGRTFDPESAVDHGKIEPQPDDRILASSDRGPCWVRRNIGGAPIDVVAVPIPELDPDEVLRDCLIPGRCMALLPLLHFLRELTSEFDWQPPPLRACLMVDDPNLHAMSYGFIGFSSLVDHAETHNYHLSSATIPLDSWYVNGRAARFFNEHADRLSLLIHGNNHSRHELAQEYTEAGRLALAAQALRRIAKFESRSGLRVARVMAAPHGKCSAPMAAALARVGFDAMCHSRPFPWIKRLPADVPLAGMAPAQWTEEGLPVLPRFSMEATETDVVLRAFLNQPLIMLGHHWDAVDNYALFERAAGIVNSLGEVQWMDMESLAHSNYAWKREGSLLRVRAYSKHLDVSVPEGVSAVEVEVPAIGEASDTGTVEVSGVESSGVRENGVLRSPKSSVTGGSCNVRWRHARRVDPVSLDLPGTSPKHLARRLATELRDRCRPLTGR